MNRSEVADLLEQLNRRYPAAKWWARDFPDVVDVWCDVLDDDVPSPAAMLAAGNWMKREKFCPDPVEIRDGAHALMAACATPQEREALDPGWMARPKGLTPEERAYSRAFKDHVAARLDATYGAVETLPPLPSSPEEIAAWRKERYGERDVLLDEAMLPPDDVTAEALG